MTIPDTDFAQLVQHLARILERARALGLAEIEREAVMALDVLTDLNFAATGDDGPLL